MKKLKSIELNNNNLTQKGAAYLINNDWPTGIKYKLDTINNTRDKGYTFNIGQTIEITKYISDRSTNRLNFDKINAIEARD